MNAPSLRTSRFVLLLTLMTLVASPALAQRSGSQDPIQRATAMHEARASGEQVAQEMQQAYRQTPEQTASIMKTVGYKANDIAGALDQTFRLRAGDIAQAMKRAGYRNTWEIAGALRAALRADIEMAWEAIADIDTVTHCAMALTMKLAGYEVLDVALQLLSRGLDITEMMDCLRNAGYSESEIGGALAYIIGG